MSSKRKSTSAKIDEEDAPGVLDFGKYRGSLQSGKWKGDDDSDDRDEVSKSHSPDSSSARQKTVKVSEEQKRLPPRACKITSWTTAGPLRRSEARETKSPRKSPKKSKSVEKGTSPLKINPDLASINKEHLEIPPYSGPPVFLVKREPIKHQDLSNQTLLDATRRRRRTKRERSPLYPPVSTQHYQPMAVIQKGQEPHLLLEELSRLLVSAISEIKSLQEILREKEEEESIEAVLIRGLMATNNRQTFKRILVWTMKNCRKDMIKKIEKKLGLKLKKKTRAQLENEGPEDLPALPKLPQQKKIGIRRPEEEEIDEGKYPNLMINRTLHGLSRIESDQKGEETENAD